jgi:hypothetical protein
MHPDLSTIITQELVMTSAAMTLIPTPGTPMIGLIAMELGVLGRYLEPVTTESVEPELPMTPW